MGSGVSQEAVLVTQAASILRNKAELTRSAYLGFWTSSDGSLQRIKCMPDTKQILVYHAEETDPWAEATIKPGRAGKPPVLVLRAGNGEIYTGTTNSAGVVTWSDGDMWVGCKAYFGLWRTADDYLVWVEMGNRVSPIAGVSPAVDEDEKYFEGITNLKLEIRQYYDDQLWASALVTGPNFSLTPINGGLTFNSEWSNDGMVWDDGDIWVRADHEAFVGVWLSMDGTAMKVSLKSYGSLGTPSDRLYKLAVEGATERNIKITDTRDPLPPTCAGGVGCHCCEMTISHCESGELWAMAKVDGCRIKLRTVGGEAFNGTLYRDGLWWNDGDLWQNLSKGKYSNVPKAVPSIVISSTESKSKPCMNTAPLKLSDTSNSKTSLVASQSKSQERIDAVLSSNATGSKKAVVFVRNAHEKSNVKVGKISDFKKKRSIDPNRLKGKKLIKKKVTKRFGTKTAAGRVGPRVVVRIAPKKIRAKNTEIKKRSEKNNVSMASKIASSKTGALKFKVSKKNDVAKTKAKTLSPQAKQVGENAGGKDEIVVKEKKEEDEERTHSRVTGEKLRSMEELATMEQTPVPTRAPYHLPPLFQKKTQT